MLNIVVFEAPQNMDDCVDFADIAEELVAEPFALACAFHETGNVNKGELCRDDFGALCNLGNLVEPLVRHGNLPDIRLDRAERIVCGLRGLRFGECIE